MELGVKKLKKSRQPGFTMVELLVYVSLLVVVSTIFFAFSADVIMGLTRLIDSKELYQNSRLMLAQVGQDIKTAKEIVNLSVEQITLRDAREQEVSYYYDAGAQKLFYSSEVGELPLGNDTIKVTDFSFEAVGKGAQINLTVAPAKTINYRGGVTELSLSSVFLPRNLIY